MKIVCTNKKSKIDTDYLQITIGKTYDTISVYDGYYEIINDNDIIWNYPKSNFITLKEHRKLKLLKLQSK